MSPQLRQLLEDIKEYMDKRADVVDRHDRTLGPNREMVYSEEIERHLNEEAAV